MIPILSWSATFSGDSGRCMPSSQPHSSFKPGDMLLDKYQVVSTLGVGGMGVVLLVRHQQLDELFALKVLKDHFATLDATVARFLREARAAVKIKSPHGARVLDVGTFPGGAPYMVMEYLQGRDLSTWLADEGALPFEQAAEFMLQSLEAIAEAHALRIVHRDIKPANLFVTKLPGGARCIKVLDFGISKASGFAGTTPKAEATEPGALMGSPSYMSPEQFSSAGTVDARSDIWAIGATLFELLTGEPAFCGDSLAKIYASIVHEPVRSIRALSPGVPQPMVAVVERCLQKDPACRYQNVGELAAALEALIPESASGRAKHIGRVVGTSTLRESGFDLGTGAPTSGANEATEPLDLIGKPKRRSWGWIALGLAVALALMTASVIKLTMQQAGVALKVEAFSVVGVASGRISQCVAALAARDALLLDVEHGRAANRGGSGVSSEAVDPPSRPQLAATSVVLASPRPNTLAAAPAATAISAHGQHRDVASPSQPLKAQQGDTAPSVPVGVATTRPSAEFGLSDSSSRSLPEIAAPLSEAEKQRLYGIRKR